MHDETLPIGPTGDDAHLPAHMPAPAGRNLASPSQARHGALSVDVLAEDRRDSDEIDLLAYWRILVKRRLLIAAVLATVVAISILLTMMATPMYRATAVMQIQDVEQNVVQVGAVAQQQGGWGNGDFITTQIALLQSRALAERVADDLNLEAADLAQLNRPGWISRVKALIRPAPKVEIAVADADPQATLRAAAGVVRGGLSVTPVKNTSLVQISYDSPVPAFSARLANAISESFIASGLERRFGATSYAKTYLEEQLALVKSRLEDSERELVAFAQKENLVSPSEGGSLVSQNLTSLNGLLAEAQAQRIRAQGRWSQAQAARGASSMTGDMLGTSMIRELQSQRAQLQGQYQQKLQVFGADYPEMRQLKGQMDEVDKQIGAEVNNIRSTVKAEYDAAASQERLLQGQLSSLRTQSLDVDDRSIDYNIIKREVDTNRQLYDGLLQRYKEVGIAGDVRANNIAIIDRAQVPGGAFSPSLRRNLAIGLLLGLVLGVLVAFLLEYLDDTLKTPEDIEERLKLAVLGIIPRLTKQTPVEAFKDPRSAFSESYRSVRTALQFSTDQGVPRVLLVTSPGPSEGKSTSALTLARNFAQMGKSVLLIEADLRNPSLHRALGTRAEVGLSNLLAGAATIFQAVVDTDDDRLKVILAGPLPPNPSELLSGSRLVSLLTIAAQHYDQIIIDGPPIMGISDAPILANAADGTVLVVHSGKTRITTAQIAVKRLVAARASITGSLLTQYDSKIAGYGYDYENYYAYGGAPQLTKR